MEDKDSSASASNDPDFAQSNGGDGRLECTTFIGGGGDDGGGQSTVKITETSATAYPAASWLEFTDWLERGLDDCGLEPTLYARCVLSILKQPPGPAIEMSVDQDEEWTPTSAANFLSVVHHHFTGRNSSAPSSRKNSFGSLASAAVAAAGPTTVKLDRDARKQALLDCLRTANTDDDADLKKFVDDIVQRYSLVCKSGVLGEKQNESVDSGVCPSPEESFQNYDEAFPPLATDRSFDGSAMEVFVGENVELRPRVASSSWLSGKRPAEARIKSAVASRCGLPEAMVGDDAKIDDEQGAAVCAQGDGSPMKRPKLLADLMESESGGRTLRSCPDFVRITPSASMCTGKQATFCCPVVKKRTSTQHPITGLRIPPQFIVPKFWKVGSWPSRYDRSTKPAGDVPFWSCSEWFCTVHKRLEFGLLNAKINGDTKSLAASAPITNASCCGNDRTPFAANPEAGSHSGSNCMDVEIFEIEPSLPPPAPQLQPQQLWNYGRTSSQQQQECEQQQTQVVPEMFDAPRFILHIINEDDAAARENFFPPQQQNNSYSSINRVDKNPSPSSDWASFFELGAADDMLFTASRNINDAQYGNDNSSSWAAPAAQSEFSLYSAVDGKGQVDVASSANAILPIDVSHMTAGEVGFCLPRCGRFPSGTQQQPQQQRQPQLLGPSTVAAVGLFNKQLETQAVEDVSLNENICPKKQPQSVAVPIRDSTHFRPIRSESMEDAYYLKPGFDEFCSVIGNIEDYYVYHHDGSGAADTTAPLKAAQALSTPGVENSAEQRRRSLVLKFRAVQPDKMCQTDEFCLDERRNLVESNESTGDVTALLERYRQEFEIWAFQPSEIRNRLNLDVSRWNSNKCDESNDEMVVGALSPNIDDGWLNDLVGSDSPPPPVQATTVRDDSAELQDGVVVDGMVLPQQQKPAAADGRQQLDIWQQEDERYEDSLLRYVSNISLISPLDTQTTTV